MPLQPGTKYVETRLGDLCDQRLLPADMPVHLRRDTYAEGWSETTARVEAAVHGFRLHSILRAAAPDPNFGHYLSDIVDDWEMPDLEDEVSVKLQELHTRVLGEHWQTFAQFRPRLLNVVIDAENRDAIRIRAFDDHVERERGWLADSPDGQRVVLDRVSAVSASARESIVRWAESKPNGKTAKLILACAGGNSLPAASLYSRKAVENIIRCLRRHNAADVLTAINELGPQQVRAQIQSGTKMEIAVGNGETMVEENHNADAVRALLAGPHVIHGSLVVPNNPPMEYVHPSLRWRTYAPDNRVWQLDAPVEGDPSDAMTGLLLAAGVTPSIKRRWPKEVPLENNGDKQPMGPPQTPVLTLIRKNDIFSSDLVKGIEKAFADAA